MRDNRIKNYIFSMADLTPATGSNLVAYSSYALNGVVKQIYYQNGSIAGTGSLFVGISGMSNIGNILAFTSGTVTHNLAEDWVVFPLATTVTTDCVPTSGADGLGQFAEIPINSIVKVTISGIDGGTGNRKASGLTILYV